MGLKNKCDWCDGKGVEPPGLFTKEELVGKICTSCKGSRFETRSTDQLVCPYCGHEDNDSWELGESDDRHQCGACDKFFKYDTQVSRTFFSERVECLNGGTHDFGDWMDFPTYKFHRCGGCGKSEREQK